MRACSRTRLILLAVLAPLTYAVSGIRSLSGQAQTGLEVTVLNQDSLPFSGAQVVLKESRAGGITDEQGVLRLVGLTSGVWTVAIVAIGYHPWAQAVMVEAGTVTKVTARLEVEAVALKPVEVSGVVPSLQRRGFYARKRLGVGTFLTRSDIEAMEARTLSDVLRRYGVNVGNDARGRPPNRMRGQQTISGPCPVQYFLDGVPAAYYNADDMRPGDIEGVEIYRGAASIPAAFKSGTAACGVIVIWTKVS